MNILIKSFDRKMKIITCHFRYDPIRFERMYSGPKNFPYTPALKIFSFLLVYTLQRAT